MIEYLEFAEKLDSLTRRADNFGHDREDILDELKALASNYRMGFERMEAQLVSE